MTAAHNAYGQPIGPALPDWTPRPRPAHQVLQGKRCRLEPLDADRHAADLYASYIKAADASDWTYLFVGPFDNKAHYREYVQSAALSEDPLHFAVIDQTTGHAAGTLALMRIDPAHGVIEVGAVTFSPLLKRTPLSTEAQFILMRYAFDELGYRRYEWKCDALNAPSRQAAERMGFTFEGIFRSAVVYKGRSRDTAWFSITVDEWPTVKAGFQRWLSPENFDFQGQQRLGLTDLRLHGGASTASPSSSSAARPGLRMAELTPSDRAAWLPLWHGYQTFYKVALGEQVDTETWNRLMDASEPMFALGAFDDDGQLLGIVHGIFHRSTWMHGPDLYLQDLYTVKAARGKGVGRALIEAVYQRGQAAGAGRVYWLTHESNRSARNLYEKLAEHTGFIEYGKDLT